MAKPEWLKRQERDHRGYHHCMQCDAGADPCGQTNYIPGEGRLTMYRCRRHPSVVFYRDTYACEDWSPRMI